jgi:hypothetical protein
MNNYKINNANVKYEFISYIHLQFSIIMIMTIRTNHVTWFLSFQIVHKTIPHKQGHTGLDYFIWPFESNVSAFKGPFLLVLVWRQLRMLVAHSQALRALPKTSSEAPSVCVCVERRGGAGHKGVLVGRATKACWWGGGVGLATKVHPARNIMLILALHQLRMLVSHSQEWRSETWSSIPMCGGGGAHKGPTSM